MEIIRISEEMVYDNIVCYLIVCHVEVDGVWWKMKRKTGKTQISADHIHFVPGHVFQAELDSFICNFTVAHLGT